jgi:hypothetical protein
MTWESYCLTGARSHLTLAACNSLEATGGQVHVLIDSDSFCSDLNR